MYLWDVSDPDDVVELPFISTDLHDQRSIQSIAFSSDGTLLASAGGFKRDNRCEPAGTSPIVVSNLASGVSETLGSVDGCVLALAFSPTVPTLASAQRDGSVMIWDVETPGEVVPIVNAHGTQTAAGFDPVPASAVAFSPNGEQIASGGWDGAVKTWAVASPLNPTLEIRGHDSVVRSVAFSPDGTLVASGGRDHVVKLWDATTGRENRELSTSHSGEVRSVAFHPGGRLLASGGADHTIVVWTVDREQRRSLAAPLHGGKVRSLLFDGQHDTVIAGGAGVVSLPDGRTGPGIVWSDVPVTGAAEVTAVPQELAAPRSIQRPERLRRATLAGRLRSGILRRADRSRRLRTSRNSDARNSSQRRAPSAASRSTRRRRCLRSASRMVRSW